MIVVMKPNASESEVESVIERLFAAGCDVHRSTGSARVTLGAVGVTAAMDLSDYEILPGVEHVVRVSTPYELVSRSYKPESTEIDLGSVVIGGDDVVVIAGPGLVESEELIHGAARAVAAAGAHILRGSAFTSRARPYAFRGHGEGSLEWLRAAADEHHLLVASEVMAPAHVELVARHADILIVGARNMQNSVLLTELGTVGKPVLLKRSPAATIEDWLLSAEYVAAAGNERIILCEQGIRTFESSTRYTMDLSAIPVLRQLSHLPVVADPSFGTGVRDKVAPMARAAVAAGADGLLIEVHQNADEALSDAAQSLYPEAFQQLMDQLRIIVPAVGRSI